MRSKKRKQLNARNLELHLILASKLSSGSAGRHSHKKSKVKTKKLEKHLEKKGFYGH
jgi:hypothetical protein